MKIVTDDDVRGVVLDVLAGIAPEAKDTVLDPDSNFRDQIDIDSVDYLNFVIALDEKLGIRIPEVDYPKLSTLNGCIKYLTSRATA